jgi:hypothetical protein
MYNLAGSIWKGSVTVPESESQTDSWALLQRISP